MKKIVTPLLLSSLLVGCGSSADYPDAQQGLIDLVEKYHEQYNDADNAIMRDRAIESRGDALCDYFSEDLDVVGWKGVVSSITTNESGAGLALSIGGDVSVKTASSSGSSRAVNSTLIQEGDAMYEMIASLGRGDQVTFSGTLFRDDHPECLFEWSLTEYGGVSRPEFMIRFSSIEPDQGS
ncbi:hypothetical protein JJO83_13895 [Halomonas aquamarina]|uniref:hypothetical protein n=1 Tax=Vreelandella aquamarina TaxID=77097 RepID=UPI00235A2D4D|nr:hypothetical protein [Halomonas aquamarina]MDC8443776.1 hypothetical protein [Halomonas aquamarina]